MAKPDEAPTLSQWVTATDVAAELGTSRQVVNKMIKRGDFKSLHLLGKRPIYVVKRSELDKVMAARASKPHIEVDEEEQEQEQQQAS